MTTWNDSKFYNEHCDLVDLSNPFVDIVPSYPIPAVRPDYNRFVDHSYNNVLAPILPSKDTLYDFPVSVDNSDTNNFDYHSFLFAASYLLINDSFLLQLLKTFAETTQSYHLYSHCSL